MDALVRRSSREDERQTSCRRILIDLAASHNRSRRRSNAAATLGSVAKLDRHAAQARVMVTEQTVPPGAETKRIGRC
jgi:hypothetical protein